MKRLKYSLPRKSLEKSFTCRMRPIIEYGIFIYDNWPKYFSNRLEHYWYGAVHQTSDDEIFTKVSWERLECRHKWHKLIMFLKMPYLALMWPPTIASTSRYVTRYSQSIGVPRCKTSSFKKYFCHQLWDPAMALTSMWEIKQFKYL